MGYIKSLGIIILMIRLTQTQQVDQEEVLEGDQGGQYTSIDNDDLYAEPRKLKQGQYLYPVIFEPIKNIRLSISSYQVTTFVDLGPYFEYFESYERYLNNFRIDLADRSRMSYLAKYHHDAGKLRHEYPETELDRIDCERQVFCNEVSNKPMCHRLVFQFCMSQRQYYQITNATKHLHTTFLTLKNRFLGIIDYWDETLQSVTVQKENTTRKKRHSTGSTVPLKAKNQIVHDMDVLTAAVEWIEKKRWNPQQPQDVWVAPEKLEMGQIITKEGARKEVHKWAELQPMTMEYLGQKLDLIDTEKYPFELPTKALLLMLIIVTLIIVIGLGVALVKWWKGHEGSKEIKNMVKLLQIKDHMRYFFPQTTLPENKASHQVREPVTPTAPVDHGTPRRRSPGLPPNVELELVEPETQVQVHALPRRSQSAPRQNPVDDEQSVVPSHHKFQRPASAYNPVDEEQSAAPFYHKPQRPVSSHILVDDEPVDPSHHNLQKEGEPV